jgi:hypothetical protein
MVTAPAAARRLRHAHRTLAATERGCRGGAAAGARLSECPAAASDGRQLAVVPLIELGDGHQFGARVHVADIAAVCDDELWQLQSAYRAYGLLHIPAQGHLTPAQELSFYQQVVGEYIEGGEWSSTVSLPGCPEVALIGHASLRDHHGFTGQVLPRGAGRRVQRSQPPPGHAALLRRVSDTHAPCAPPPPPPSIIPSPSPIATSPKRGFV